MRLAGLDYVSRKAREAIPPGYGVVREGPILPDDLCYCWPDGGFELASSPDWLSGLPDDASDAVLVVRRAVFPQIASARRTYKISRAIATPDPASSTRVNDAEKGVASGQRSLF